jgi:hypothetical protein
MQLFNWEIFAFHHRTGLRLCGAKGRVSGAFALMTNGVFVLSGVMAMRNKLKLRITTEEVSMAKRRIAPVHPGFYWMNLQGRYEMDVAEDALSDKVAREVRPLMAAG